MKSIVLYYSYTGNTKKVAEKLAKMARAFSFETMLELLQPKEGLS